MPILILLVITVLMAATWFSLMKSESYKTRLIGGFIFILITLFIYDFVRLAARSYEIGFYQMSLTKIRELIESGNGGRAVEPILTFEEISHEDSWLSYPAVAGLYGDISKETKDLNQTEQDNPITRPCNSKNH